MTPKEVKVTLKDGRVFTFESDSSMDGLVDIILYQPFLRSDSYALRSTEITSIELIEPEEDGCQ